MKKAKKTRLMWLEFCKSCGHSFYVTVSGRNKIAGYIRRIFGKEENLKHTARCRICSGRALKTLALIKKPVRSKG